MTVLIPIAREVQSGKHVTADEVPRGNACGCECLFCGVPMQVRLRGGIRFFAHQPREVDDDTLCEVNFARCLFWMARKVLSEHDAIRLPAYELTLSDRDVRLKETYTVTPERSVTYAEVSYPAVQITPHYDTAILNISGHSLWLQLCFDAAVAPNRGDSTTPTLVVNISSLESAFNQVKRSFKEATVAALLHQVENKHWLYHPREEHVRQLFEAAVAAAREARARTHSPIVAPAAKAAFEDVRGLNRRRIVPPVPVNIQPAQPAQPAQGGSKVAVERLQRYWRKLEKELLIHVPIPEGGERVVALHQMGQGFWHKKLKIHAVCTRHERTFYLHLNCAALTDLSTDILGPLGEFNRPTLVICFGHPTKPIECMWVNQQPGYAIS